MTFFSKLRKSSILGIGALAIGSLLYYNFESIFPNIYLENFKNIQNAPSSKWDHNWDRRYFKSDRKSIKDATDSEHKIRIKTVRHVILVRHGQYNTQGKTDNERHLTNLGKLQAEVTGMRLAEIAVPYTTIIRSTMTRAQETSTLIQAFLPTVPVVDDSLLVEGTPIPPDPPSGHWKSEKTFFQDGPRIEAAFRKYFYRAEFSDENDTYTIIVCHANVIRYFICRALQFPPEGWLRMSLNHGSITWIAIFPNGRVILRCFGETGHMMPQWITSN